MWVQELRMKVGGVALNCSIANVTSYVHLMFTHVSLMFTHSRSESLRAAVLTER